MRPFAAIAAALAAGFIFCADGAAAAPQDARAAAAEGLAPEAVRDWIVSLGGDADAVQREPEVTWFVVRDAGLTWLVFFYNCEQTTCGDLQFAASFLSATATAERINAWNRDQRFAKAHVSPRTDGQGLDAVVMFDLLLGPGGVEQLVEPLTLWLGQLGLFADHVGYARPAAPAAGQ